MTLSAYFAAAAEHQQLAWMSDTILEVLVDSAVSDGQVLIMRSATARGNAVPVHVHQREDEIFLLLNGALTVWVGDQRRELSDGGVAFLPKGIPHTYFVTSQTAVILEVIAPGGLERAFREAGWIYTPRRLRAGPARPMQWPRPWPSWAAQSWDHRPAVPGIIPYLRKASHETRLRRPPIAV